MNQLDEKIRQALSEEDQQLLAQFDESIDFTSLLTETFSGRMKYVNRTVLVVGIFAIILCVYSAYAYFNSTELLDRITWATAFLVFFLGNISLRIWLWINMHTLSLAKDIRRLELRLLTHDDGPS